MIELSLDERLRRARILGSFIAYYHAGREWYADWFNALPRDDQQIVFDWMIYERRGNERKIRESIR